MVRSKVSSSSTIKLRKVSDLDFEFNILMIDCKGGGNNWLLNNDQFDNLITNSLKLHTIKLPVCFVKITILIGGGIFEMLDLPSRFHEMNNFSG